MRIKNELKDQNQRSLHLQCTQLNEEKKTIEKIYKTQHERAARNARYLYLKYYKKYYPFYTFHTQSIILN